MAERYVVGIDGGQTGTTCLIARSSGQIVGQGTGGPVVHLGRPDARETMRRAFEQAAGEAWQAAGLAPSACAAAYLGLSGVEAGTSEASIAEEIGAGVLRTEAVKAANDATSALAGALLGKPGVVIIAGTGAIALGVNEAGHTAFSGGWGWLLGDEGSAFDLGHRGLLAAVHAWDGRGPATALTDLFQAHFCVAHYFDVKRIVFGSPLDARIFAGLAPIVVQAARDGDRVARLIVSSGARDLARAAAAVIARLSYTSPIVPTSYAGGVFRAGAIVLTPLARELRRLQPRARLVAPALPGSCGSLLLALRAAGDLNDASAAALVTSARQLGWSRIE